MIRIIVLLGAILAGMAAPVAVFVWVRGSVETGIASLLVMESTLNGATPWIQGAQSVSGFQAVLAFANSIFPFDIFAAYLSAYTTFAGFLIAFRWVKSFVPTVAN